VRALEWKFRIKEVLADNPNSPINDQTINVVRAGGTVLVNGHKIIGTESEFPDFQPGDEYLMYLKHIPETGYYKASGVRTYNLSHGTVPVKPNSYTQVAKKTFLSMSCLRTLEQQSLPLVPAVTQQAGAPTG